MTLHQHFKERGGDELWGVGSRGWGPKIEVGGKWEVGSGKWEVGSGRPRSPTTKNTQVERWETLK